MFFSIASRRPRRRPVADSSATTDCGPRASALSTWCTCSGTGMVAVASLEPATVAEVLKNNLAEVKQGEALLRLGDG